MFKNIEWCSHPTAVHSRRKLSPIGYYNYRSDIEICQEFIWRCCKQRVLNPSGAGDSFLFCNCPGTTANWEIERILQRIEDHNELKRTDWLHLRHYNELRNRTNWLQRIQEYNGLGRRSQWVRKNSFSSLIRCSVLIRSFPQFAVVPILQSTIVNHQSSIINPTAPPGITLHSYNHQS